jgi:hypothetical protein
MKTCNRCNVSKTFDGFSPDSRMSDGYINVCRQCRTEEIKARKVKVKAGIGLKHVTEKRCNKCTRVKPREEFNKSPGCLDGLAARCKTCNAEKMADYRKENRPAYNSYMREYNARQSPYERYLVEILRRYGCTKEMYEGMLVAQEFKCALNCGAVYNDKKRKGRLYVDHCHDSLKIRGLLCNACNCMLGYAKDNTRVMLEAVAYVARNK